MPPSRIVKAAAAFAVLLLAGCAGSGDSLSGLMVTPGRYDIYHCDQLARSIPGMAARVRQLENLKAKAETGTAGPLVSTAAYEPDYLAARGALKEMRRSAREKHCDIPGVAPAALPPPPGTASVPPSAKKKAAPPPAKKKTATP